MIEILLNLPDPEKNYKTNAGRYQYKIDRPGLQLFDRMPIRALDNSKMPNQKGMYPLNIITSKTI